MRLYGLGTFAWMTKPSVWFCFVFYKVNYTMTKNITRCPCCSSFFMDFEINRHFITSHQAGVAPSIHFLQPTLCILLYCIHKANLIKVLPLLVACSNLQFFFNFWNFFLSSKQTYTVPLLLSPPPIFFLNCILTFVWQTFVFILPALPLALDCWITRSNAPQSWPVWSRWTTVGQLSIVKTTFKMPLGQPPTKNQIV